mgnify:CR=1 FL=1
MYLLASPWGTTRGSTAFTKIVVVMKLMLIMLCTCLCAMAGNVILGDGNLEDIDEQVSAELALRASEERYRLASLATNDVI